MESSIKFRLARTGLALLLALVSCESPEPGPDDDGAAAKMGGATIQVDRNCNNQVDLVIGQDLEVVGSLLVELADGTINVDYMMQDDWFITEIHTHFFTDDEDFVDIPLQEGNADPGSFLYKSSHDFLCELDCEYENTVPVLKHLLMSAQVNVARLVEESCETLEELAARLPKDSVELDVQLSRTDSYYQVNVSQAGTFNGEYLGWCMDNNGQPVVSPRARLISSYSEDADLLSSVVVSPDNLDLLNYLMNTWFDRASFPAVQGAIWTLMNGQFRNRSGGIKLSDDEWEQYQALMADVNTHGEGYRPGCGDYVVLVVASPDRAKWQNVCILTKAENRSIYQYETAWGFGSGFPGGDCSMYFKACEDEGGTDKLFLAQ